MSRVSSRHNLIYFGCTGSMLLCRLSLFGFPGGSAGKESACSAGHLGSIPWRRERLPTPVFWSGEFHGLYGPRGREESDTTEQLSPSQAFYSCAEQGLLLLAVRGLPTAVAFPGVEHGR